MKIKFVFAIIVLGLVICLGMKMSFKSGFSSPTLKQIAAIDLPGEVGNRFNQEKSVSYDVFAVLEQNKKLKDNPKNKGLDEDF